MTRKGKCHACGQETIEHESLLQKIREESLDGCDMTLGKIEAQGINSVKWYDHEDDMQTISAEYPDALFVLGGEGEESGDIWVKYFKGGQMQVAKAEIRVEPFDPKKLK